MTANAYIRPNLAVSNIKHDPARSCFQLWPKIGDEGDKISREKNWRGTSRQIMFYVIYPELWKISVKNGFFLIY